MQSALSKWFKGERSTRLELCVDGRFVNMRFVSLSFTQLIISVESHIYQLAYSRLVLYCVAHIFHPWSLGVLSVYSYVSLISQTQLFCMHVYVLLPSFLALQDSPGLSYMFPAPVLE